jgi:hypothetical protein
MILTDVTTPALIFATPVAPVPPPPTNLTIGAKAYPLPPAPLGIVTKDTKDVCNTATACACLVVVFCKAIPFVPAGAVAFAPVAELNVMEVGVAPPTQLTTSASLGIPLPKRGCPTASASGATIPVTDVKTFVPTVNIAYVNVIVVVGASIVMVGGEVYPLPEEVITIEPTANVVDPAASGIITAYPVARVASWLVPAGGEGGAEKVTVGADVY